MSSTGPMTRATRPLTAAESVVVSSTVAVMVSLSIGLGSISERVRATHDLADLLGDAGLACLVRQARVLLDEVLGVVGRGLHGLLSCGELGSSRLQQAVVDAAVEVLRQ